MLSDFLKSILVPSDDYFENKFSDLKTKFSEKANFDFSALESLELESDGLSPITYTMNGSTHTFLDFSILNDNIVFIRSAISTILFLFLYLYNYRNLMYMIKGRSNIQSGKGGGD